MVNHIAKCCAKLVGEKIDDAAMTHSKVDIMEGIECILNIEMLAPNFTATLHVFGVERRRPKPRAVCHGTGPRSSSSGTGRPPAKRL